MRYAKRAFAVVAVAALVGCSNPTGPTTAPTSEMTLLQIHSTRTAAPLLNELTRAYQAEQPLVRVEMATANHSVLMNRLLTGDIPYFLSSHLPAQSDLWAAPIAQDGIVLIVNAANPARDLSTEQIRRLYQGIGSNWLAANGADLPVSLYSREQGSGLRSEFERLVMGQRPVAPTAQIVPSAAAAIQRIQQDAGALAYIPYSQRSNDVRLLAVNGVQPTTETIRSQRYPLRSTLFIIGRREPTDAYRVFFGWIQSPEGQATVSQTFVPLVR